MNGQNMIDEIKEHGFDDLSDVRLLGFINDAYYDLCSREAWPFMEKESDIPTVAGTATLALPSDYDAALSLVNLTTGTVLVPERRDVIHKRYAAQLTTIQGEPSFYYPLGDSQVNMLPIPDSIYTLRLTYLCVPAAIAVGTSPIMNTKYHRVLVIGALARANAMEDEEETAAMFSQQFDDRIAKMREDMWQRQFDRPQMIGDLFVNDDWLY